jgi:hypothetical protein
MPSYAILEASEDIVNSEFTFNLTRTSAHITVTNDHNSQDLQFKFDPAAPVWCTLKPHETISMEFSTMTVLVKGVDVPYRIWAFS